MKKTNWISRNSGLLICGLACIVLVGQSSVVAAAGLTFPDDLKVREHFSFFGGGGFDWEALTDPNNNPIFLACLKGVADESLKPPGILDVQRRLERLERGGLIKKEGGRYSLAFPAVVGNKRDQLQKFAEQAAVQLAPFGEKMVAQIRANLAGRDEMAYHVLWSVVMDGGPAWDAARAEMTKKIAAGDTSTENKAWLLYPSHPFEVGTNSYNNSYGHLAITWSRNTARPDVVGRVMSQHISQLAQAVEQNTAITSAQAKDALGKYGLIDESGKVGLYVIKANSQAAQLYAELSAQFGRQIMTQLDVNKVAGMLEVSPGIAFVIAYHEICYQLLQNLSEKKVLEVPSIVVKGGADTSQTRRLVSLVSVPSANSPLPDTEMSREEAQAIEEYRRIKARILAGESYKDTSTPLHSALTQFSAWKPQERGYFTDLDILRAPLPPAKPEEGSLWPVFAGREELEDTFILVYSNGQWIWIGNIGAGYDWRTARSAFEKWARDKIGPTARAAGSGNPPAQEAQTPGQSTGNRVLSLDGRDDCMRVADSPSLQSFTDAITIEVWLKASSFYAGEGMINSLVRKNVASGAENFLLRFRNMGGSPRAQMGLGPLGTLDAPFEFAANNWYHLAGTYDGRAITILVNGQAVASQNASGRLRIDQSDLYIGKGDPASFSSGECFHGALDEIRIWSVARSQEQIRVAMNTSLTGKEEGLVGYWNFDDGAAKDLSGHSNDGVLVADAKIVESARPAAVATQQELPIIAWWKLDEADGNDVADSSGNGHAGKLMGNPCWQPAGGKVGGALVFDGGGDSVEIKDEPAFDLTGPITISAWIKVGSFDKRWQAIVTKGDTAWRLQRTAEENTLAFHCTGITSISGQWSQGIEGKKNVNDGQWHHVVGVYDGAAIALYIDGVLDNSSKASGAIQTNDSAVIVGGNSEQAGRDWNGLIDEVCIIAGAIDANAAHALYVGTNPVTVARAANPQLQGPGKLLAWWKFENDPNDSAGTNHGAVHGNPTFVDGKAGRAISFDGNDYVDCGKPSLLNFGTGDWTISAWIKTTQSGTDPANRGTVFAYGGDEAGGIRYTLAVNEEYLGTAVLTTDDDAYKIQAFGKTAVNDGNWHHVVGMRNAEQLRVYVDGALDADASLPSGCDLSGVSQHNAYIGTITDHRDNSLFKYFVGQIDEVCILGGAIDANGVRSLYAGEDPAKVAQTAIIARAAPRPSPPQVGVAGEGIEGDWQVVSSQAVIEVRKKPDGALAAAIVAQSSDVTAPTISLDEVTFENRTFRFKLISNQADFEGTMKEDGSSIEGQFRQQGQPRAVTLARIKPAPRPTETAPAVQDQPQAQTRGTSRIATAVVLVLVLAGVIAAVVFFLVRSSINR